MPNAISTLRMLPKQNAAPGGLRRPAKARTEAPAYSQGSRAPWLLFLVRHGAKTVKRVPAGCTSRQDGAAPKRPAEPRFRRGIARKRPVLLASERSGGKNAGVRNSPNALIQTNAVVPGSHGTQGALGMSPHAVPNPSFKRSANGRPPSPGRRYAVHFRQPGLGVLPSSPA